MELLKRLYVCRELGRGKRDKGQYPCPFYRRGHFALMLCAIARESARHYPPTFGNKRLKESGVLEIDYNLFIHAKAACPAPCDHLKFFRPLFYFSFGLFAFESKRHFYSSLDSLSS
jgi:hypothetical protein